MDTKTRKRWSLRIALASGVLISSSLTTTSAQSAEGIDWCIDGNQGACIVSAFRDGVEIFHDDPVFKFHTASSEINGTFYSHIVLMARYNNTVWVDPAEEGHTWTVKVNMRQHPAHVAFIRGTEGPVVRGVESNGEHTITFTSQPIAVSASCDGNAVCAPVATSEWRSYLELVAYEPAWYADAGMTPEAWSGFNIWTNVDRIDTPPTRRKDTLEQFLASPHYRMDGTTVIEGWIVEELPYSVVRGAIFTDDPETLVGSSIVTTLSGPGTGSVSVTNQPDKQVLRLEATGVTFSERVLTIKRGIVTPRAGTINKAVRLKDKTKVRVSYPAGSGRGSIIIGYQAKCFNKVNGRVVLTRYKSASASARSMYVSGLTRSGTWHCSLRVNSTAGFGSWGSAVKVATT